MPPRINEELRKLLCDVRARRNFKEREWIDGKCAMLNDYMKKSGLTACVINMSGGVDSSCVAALCMEASKKPGSPIEKVLGIAQPIKSTASIQNRAYECANAIGLEIVTIDQSAVFDSLTPIVHQAVCLIVAIHLIFPFFLLSLGWDHWQSVCNGTAEVLHAYSGCILRCPAFGVQW